MRYLAHKSTLYVSAFLSICLIIIWFVLKMIFIPIQDLNLINRQALIELQREYAINYPLGIVLFYLGILLLIFTIILFVIKVRKQNSNR